MDLDTRPRVSATQRTRKLVPILAGCALVGGAYATGAAAGSDSRMTPGSTRCFQAAGEPGDIAILNVTMVDANGPGFVTVRSPDDSDSRTFSNNNFDVGTFIPNVALAQIGTDGQVCIQISDHNSVHAIVDQLATLDADAAQMVNQRLLDTRLATARFDPDAVCLAPGAVRRVTLRNDSSERLEVAQWAVLLDSSGRAAYQVGTSVAAPRVVAIEPTTSTTVPPVAPSVVEPDTEIEVAIQAPPQVGTYRLVSLVTGAEPVLTITVAGDCSP